MYDLAVIGAGWAGFNAALKAKELGLRACLIEASQIGGTCLNLGCIPTKALIQSAKVFSLIKKSQTFGLEPLNPVLNFIKAQERKDKIIAQIRSGMQFMLKGIDLIEGKAQFTANDEINAGGKLIKAKFFIIACGSRPYELSGFPFDAKKIISSNDALNLTEVPGRLLIIGGGVIGCEFAGLFSALGSQVTIVEKMPQLLPAEDKEIARKIETSFKKQGIKVLTNSDALAQDLSIFDQVLVAVGRTPNTEELGLEKIGLNLERRKIVVDDFLATNIPNIYAAGDCCAKIMLAHFAAYQGLIAAENIALGNKKKAVNPNVPSCIFTDPEAASVGLSEDAARAAGLDIRVSKYDFLGSGMARILDEADGFIKVISEIGTMKVLGASIVGPKATELIAVFGVAVSSGITVPEIKETIFAHPTLSESIHEALK